MDLLRYVRVIDNQMIFIFLLIYLVDGKWGEWEAWSECSTTCGPGTKVRTRECGSPAPQYGGECPGNGQETEPCTIRPCPISKLTLQKQ